MLKFGNKGCFPAPVSKQICYFHYRITGEASAQMNKFISRDTALRLLQHLQEAAFPFVYEYEKHRVVLLDDNKDELVYFRLPIVIPPLTTATSLSSWDSTQHYVILLIQSGNCALGYFEDGENLDHKVYRSYMVRKKQGVSQIKYLKTKGKSRAGSRVRLGETAEFFENINGRLQTYFQEHEVHRIAISCSKTLQPYLYNSSVATPFDKQDERLFKIPKHIHTPIYEVMMDANKFLQKGELIFEEQEQALVEELLAKATGTAADTEDD